MGAGMLRSRAGLVALMGCPRGRRYIAKAVARRGSRQWLWFDAKRSPNWHVSRLAAFMVASGTGAEAGRPGSKDCCGKMSPLIQMFAGLLLAAVAACGTISSGFLAKSGYDRHVASSVVPNISFQKIALFWVNVDEGIYQLGAVAKLFNSDSKSYSINGPPRLKGEIGILLARVLPRQKTG